MRIVYGGIMQKICSYLLLLGCICLLLINGCKNLSGSKLNYDNTTANAVNEFSHDESTDEMLTENKNGSLNGNLLNGGIAAFHEGYVYYVNDNQTKLYKWNCTTQEEEQIYEDEKISQLNISENYIYYLDAKGNVIRLDLDGNDKKLIYENKSISFQNTCIVNNNCIYYAKYNEYGKETSSLIRMDLTGSEVKTLTEECNGYVSLYDNWLYYSSSIDGSIWKIKCDGTENQKIIDGKVTHFLVEDNAIYYVKAFQDVFRSDLDGKQTDTLYHGEVLGLNIYNNNIIILDKNYNPVLLENEKTKILSDMELLKICIVDNKIFYLDTNWKMGQPILIQ